MQSWIIKLIVGWLINNLTEEKVKEWTDQFKQWVMPILVKYKVEIFTKLHAEAAKTENELDDAAVIALEMVVEQFIK